MQQYIKIYLISLMFLGQNVIIYSQICYDTTLSSISVCRNEQISIVDSQIRLVNYCANSINGSLQLENTTPFLNNESIVNIESVNDSINLFSFLPNYNQNHILRVQHSINDLSKSYIDTLIKEINGPQTLKVIQEGTSKAWYMFSIDTKAKNIVRYSFADSLSSNIIDSISFDLNFGLHTYIDIFNYDGKWLLSSVSFLDHKLNFYEIGDSFENNTITLMKSFNISGVISNPFHIQYFSMCENAFLSITNLNKVQAIFQLTTIDNELNLEKKIVSNITIPNSIKTRRHDIINVKNNSFETLVAGNSSLHIIHYIYKEGVFFLTNQKELTQGINSCFGVNAIQNNEKWIIQSINSRSYDSYYLKDSNCIIQNNTFTTSGVKSIEYIKKISTRTYRVHQNVIVNQFSSPVISIMNDGSCINQALNFSIHSTKGLSKALWDFNHGHISTSLNASHKYTSLGRHIIHLSILDTNNCSQQKIDTINIYEAPLPNFTFPTPICTNNEITFNNTSTGETGEVVDWAWKINQDTVGQSGQLDSVFTNSSTFSLQLNASIPGCSDSITKEVTVISGPQINLAAEEVCFGDSTEFVNLTTGENLTGYKWYFGNGDSSILESPTVLYDTAQVVEIRLVANNAAGCKNTFDTSYIVHPLPVIDFDNGLSCSNALTEFYNRSSITADTLVSYRWELNDDSVSAAKDPTIYVDTAGNNFVSLTAISSFGCESTFKKAISTIQSPQIAILTEEDCFGEPTKFTDNTDDIESITDRKWSIKSIDVTSISSAFRHTFEAEGEYTVYLTVSSSTGCKALDSTVIGVSPLPQPTFSTSQLCLSDSINFVNTSTIGDGDSIQRTRWFFETAGFQEGSDVKVKFDNSGEENIIIELLTKNGCSVTSSSSIEIKQNADANFVLDKNIGTAPLSINATAINNAGEHTWIGTTKDTLRTGVISATYDTNNTYSLLHILKNTNGCIDSVSQSIFVGNYVFDLAILGVGLSDSLGSTYLTVLLQNNSPITVVSPALYIDLNNGVTLNAKVKQNIAPNVITSIKIPIGISNLSIDEGNYVCVTIDTNDVKDVVSENNRYCLLLREELDVSMPNPNPTSGEVNFDVYSPLEQTVTISLYNTVGELLKEKTVQLSVGNNTIIENLAQYSNGIYIIDVNSENKHTKLRVSKH